MAAAAPPPALQQALALMMQGIALEQQQQLQPALAAIDAALQLDPLCLPALMRRGALLQSMARHEESAAAFDQALAIAPHLEDAERQRSAALTAALAQADAAINQQAASTGGSAGRASANLPSSQENVLRRARLLAQLDRYTEALADLDTLLDAAPRDTGARNLRAAILLKLAQAQAALADYDVLAQALPNNAAVLFNRANVLQQLLRMDEAIGAYRQVEALQADFAEARLEQAFCLLAQGDFARGWPLLEARWQTAQLRGHHLASAAPLWTGGALPGGAHLLLWAEQGVGDTLQFVRFVTRVADLARQSNAPARVTLRVPTALLALLQQIEAQGVSLIANTAPLPSHDLQCPLMSLPLALGALSEADLGDGQPYLHADPALITLWRQRLPAPAASVRRIGLAWAGRQYRPVNRSRDVPLADLQAALTRMESTGQATPCLISLQKDIPVADRSLAQAMPQLQFPATVPEDWADTAAMIATLDLVVSVDTAVAHLAAALGKPVWLLLRRAGEWRWQTRRQDSPWYPTLRIFRQNKAGDWAGVLDEVAGELGRCQDVGHSQRNHGA